MTADRAPRRVHDGDSRSADRPAIPEQHHSRRSHRSGRRARSWRWCRCRTPPAPTTSSASRTSRTSRIATWLRVDLPLGNSNNVFARYIYSDRFRFVPGWFGGVLDGTSTSAWGRNFLDRTRWSAAGPRCSARSLVNESRFSYARGTNDGTQDPFGESGMAQIGFKGVPERPARRRRHRRHRHRRPHPARLAELHAEVPAHRARCSGSTP